MGMLLVAGKKWAVASAMLEQIRGHWKVENNLHWQLDVTFREDEKRIRVGHGAESFSRLCRLALNRLEADNTTKASIHTKRLIAAWDDYFLFKLLTIRTCDCPEPHSAWVFGQLIIENTNCNCMHPSRRFH